MELQPTGPFGKDDLLPNGVSNLIGVRPGAKAWNFEGAFMQNCTWMVVPFTTTHEAIGAFLPPPLQPVEDLPPTVTAMIHHTVNHQGRDGREFAYTMVGLHAFARFNDVTGRTLLMEYVDSPYGDKTTVVDQLVSGGYYLGMPKKSGDIRFRPVADAIEATLDRHGERLMTMRVRRNEPIEAKPIQLDELVGNRSLAVREIPSVDYRSFSERCVVQYSWDHGAGFSAPGQVWSADASLTFGSIELDPLGLLEIVDYGPAYIATGDVPKERFTDPKVLEYLDV